MKLKNVFLRFRHVIHNPQEALWRFLRREVLRIVGVDLSKQTEIQYVELGMFKSKILSRVTIADAQEIVFSSREGIFSHNFNSKYLIEITNVIVNTSTNHVYVIGATDSEFYLLRESSEWPSETEIIRERSPRGIPKQRLSNVGLGLPNSGYYHWLSEDLPNFLVNKKIPVVQNRDLSILNKSVMEFQGIDSIQTDKWIMVESLTFITKNQDLGYIHPESIKVLRNFSERVVGQGKKKIDRIYISRKDFRRTIVGESLIEDYLSAKGFLIVRAEVLSFAEQIQLFSDAKLIIGIHGAGFTNAIWSKNCKIIELMPNNRINRCFEWQSYVCGHSYQVVYFHPTESPSQTIIAQLENISL